MCVPIILGSDKTTISVGTGDIEYHLLYLSIGTIHNSVRRAHRNGVVPIGSLAIPKGMNHLRAHFHEQKHSFYVLDDRKYDNNMKFRQFKHQLYNSSISAILSTLKPAMKTPTVYRCSDGHFHWVIFILGPFIADYPEQAMLSGVLQNWCPRYVCISHSSLIVLWTQWKMILIAVPHFQQILMVLLVLEWTHWQIPW